MAIHARIRAACLIKAHVSEDNEVLRNLLRTQTPRLDIRKDKVHCLLEVRTETLTNIANLSYTLKDVILTTHLMPLRLGVEGEELIRAAHLRNEETKSKRDHFRNTIH